MNKKYIYQLAIMCVCSIIAYGCKSNFPQDLDAFSLDMNFSRTEYQPILGRSTVYQGNFNSGESSLPLNFRISSVRTFEGKEAPELLKLFPASVWTSRYTGEEKSLAEIAAKRDTIMRPLWEIGEHSGTFTMWESSGSHILKVMPDSGYVFDVEVSSSGGRRYFRDLKLKPLLEQPVESVAGMLLGVQGDSTRLSMNPQSVKLWFNKIGNGSTITFKVLDPDLKPIPLTKFNTTKWDEMIHGFNKRFSADNSSVTYDVAYPIPLVPTVRTKYINNSGEAVAFLSYERIGFGGLRLTSAVSIPFRVYEKGDWEVVLYFSEESPLFDND